MNINIDININLNRNINKNIYNIKCICIYACKNKCIYTHFSDFSYKLNQNSSGTVATSVFLCFARRCQSLTTESPSGRSCAKTKHWPTYRRASQIISDIFGQNHFFLFFVAVYWGSNSVWAGLPLLAFVRNQKWFVAATFCRAGVMRDCAAGNANLYYTPSDVDLSIETKKWRKNDAVWVSGRF